MVPQSPAVLPKTQATGVTPPATDFRAQQKRWPMALSVWAAVGVSLALWTGIFWLISLVATIFG